MQSVLIVIHILIVIALVAIVLLQRSEGGALGTGSTSNFMTGRGQANALSRATAILAAMFFTTSLLMSILAGWSRAPHSILEKTAAPAAPAVPQPVNPGNIMDQLKQLQGQANVPAAPAAPSPAPAAPAAPAQKP
ncbi:MAG: preprotein translocase subunit SecG [Hyphomicrobiales bacterium]|nr:preprotein translocase subunit SecG [Hyphomicrobiales bacterium]